MSTDNSFGSYDPAASEHRPVREKKPMSGCAMAGIGCGIALVLLLIVGGIGAWYINKNIREFGTEFVVMAMKEGVSELDVPADQLARIHARIDDVGQQFKDGQLEMEQVESIFARISQGPLMSAGMSLFFKRTYMQESGLSEEELAAADNTLQRFARAAIDKSISEQQTEAVLDLISVKGKDGQREFKERLTDDELRAFLKAASTAADEAGVPEAVPEINLADEFDKAIDEALNEHDSSGTTDFMVPAEKAESEQEENVPGTH